MRTGTNAVAVCVVMCFYTSIASAQVRNMTLADVVERARERAPQIVSARLAVDEARARLLGASVRFPANPQIDAALGNRNGTDTRFTDFELGLGQSFEPGARRSARIDGANAAIAQSSANVDEVTRAVLRLATSAYYRAVYANERISLLNAAFELASSVYATADRRFKAGDIAVLDVNIARASLARVRADREGAEASKALALGELRQLLRLESDVAVPGSLSRPGEAELNIALQAASQRPELRALEAGIQEAEAELRLGLSFSKPEYGVGVRYSREEGDQIVLGGMTVTLPMFSRGQEQRAVGSARGARLRAELDAARTRVQQEVRAAFDAYTRRLSALRILEADAIPGVDENEQLTTRSFDVGQLGLPELLLLRREILETRFQYLDALLEAALARTDLDASAGLQR
ncbi:MAG TPA: TolC family protein [Vicinamibacterales bacterium]|nr:TolC family protein [Vicinamibacterales bacterium]